MIEITAIRLAGGNGHEHITDVQWRSAATAEGQSNRQAIVDWLSASKDNHAVVVSGSETLPVAVVLAPNQPAYIRACSDGSWTDDLLALPTF